MNDCKGKSEEQSVRAEILFTGVTGSGAVNPLTGNAVVSRGADEEGLLIMFEILGQTGVAPNRAYPVAGGESKYRRILIRRVFVRCEGGALVAQERTVPPKRSRC